MTELRRNHSLFDSGPFIKAGLFAVLLAGLYYFLSDSSLASEDYTDQQKETTELGNPANNAKTVNYLPSSPNSQVVKHTYYTMSYNEEHEQPEWVAYELSAEQFKGKGFKRKDNFRPDPKVKTKSAGLSDYKRSGYDRGHLVPAGDMTFDERAMSETFYMSNMSPQIRNFNGGIWRELEENTRDWAKKFKHLYVVSGPVLTVRPLGEIGRNDVSIPRSYYKVLLDITGPELKGIGFILDNEVSDEHLSNYAVTIDEVESLTGIDFFPNLLSPEEEALLEGNIEIGRWKFSDKRYRTRIKSWNKR